MRSILIAALAVSACNGENKAICVTPPTLEQSLKEPNTAAGWAAKNDGCVARWATRLATAPGSISEVARASLGGCVDGFASRASAQSAEDRKDGFAIPSYSELVAGYRRDAMEQAMFYVATARAGHCAPS